MPRILSASLRREIERQETDEALIAFLTITHPDLDAAIRVCSDGVDYVWGGETFIGFPFDAQLLTDGDQPPVAQLAVQNVDRRIGNSLRSLTGPARLRLDIVAASWFDRSAAPRLPIAAEPSAEYTADKLFLANVKCDDLQITADIVSWNYLQDIWPGLRATQNRLPGLFR